MNMQRNLLLINRLLTMDFYPRCSVAVNSSTSVAQTIGSPISTQNLLEQLTTFTYKDSDFQTRITDGRLATLYVQLERQRIWGQNLQALTNQTPQLIDINNHLQKLTDSIQAFYASYVKKSWIGEQEVRERPDIIVILGANRTVLEQRLTFSLPIINDFPLVPIVLSGGGRSFELEAEVMRDFLQRHNVTNPLIMESDSLDTVGNAVFTYFALKKHHIPGKSILLITSSFHGPRSLFLFQKILPPEYKLAVALAPYDSEDLTARIDRELQELATSIDTLLHWRILPKGACSAPTKNACDVFFQMLMYNNLYLSRWDLARKYSSLCQLNMENNESTPST